MLVFLDVDDSCLVCRHKDFKGAPKSYFTHYPCAVAALFNMGLFNKSVFPTYSF